VNDDFRKSNCFIIGLNPVGFRNGNKNNASAMERSGERSGQFRKTENSCNLEGERLPTNESLVQKAASSQNKIKNSIHGHNFMAASKYGSPKIHTQEEALEIFSHPDIRLSKKVTGYMDMSGPPNEKLF
jgi:hypothetical protein